MKEKIADFKKNWADWQIEGLLVKKNFPLSSWKKQLAAYPYKSFVNNGLYLALKRSKE